MLLLRAISPSFNKFKVGNSMKNVAKTVKNLSLLAVLALATAPVMAGEKIDQILKTSADGRVSIDVMSGEVQIKSWDKNEVKVTGELDDDADGYQFEESNGRVVFKVHMPQQRWGSWKDDAGSNLIFWVPKQNDIRFEGVNTSVSVKDIYGGSRINTVNGDIEASTLSKRVSLETVNGRIYSANLEGKIKLMTVNGEIEDRDSRGELEIEAVNGDINTVTEAAELNVNNVNGDIDLKLKNIKELEINTVNGDMDVELRTQRNAKVYISSVGGDANLTFDKSFAGTITVEAHSGGDITNKINGQRPKSERYGPGESLRLSMGSEPVEVEIDTVSGDIKLMKK